MTTVFLFLLPIHWIMLWALAALWTPDFWLRFVRERFCGSDKLIFVYCLTAQGKPLLC
jgi:hypothetical protein